MSWVKLDDRIFLNPKFRAASDGARLLYFSGLCFAAQSESDGLILDDDLPVAGAYARAKDVAKAADELVGIGLWERMHNGYQIHDYLEFQPSRAYLAAERKRKREWIAATRRGSSGASSTSTGGASSGECAPSRPVPVPDPIPVPIPKKKRSPAQRVESVGFIKFYSAYPRHVARQAAAKAWPGDDHLPAIMAALEWQAPEFRNRERDKIPHPATWLNGKRWEDEKPPEQDGLRWHAAQDTP